MSKTKEATITFVGGSGSTTGSNFLFSIGESSILVDCGLTQGEKVCEDLNYEPFPYDPKTVGALFVTHAHLDHIGRIPKLVKEGFSGSIYSTEATMEIAKIVFEDGVSIMRSEAKVSDKEPLYEKMDVEKALLLWKAVDYHETIKTDKDIEVVFKDAGHILGSAMVEVLAEGKKFVFTGDLGNSPAPLLKNTEEITDANYLVVESVYGDRAHESIETRHEKLEDIIEQTVRENGVLLIPAFSIERTQTLLYEINNLVERGQIPEIPVFLDSPLAIKVTELYKRSHLYFNERTKHIIKSGDDIFHFPGLTFTDSVSESKGIAETPNPKIIIAGSGMSNGGRILHHEKRYLGDPTTTLLIVGFQAAGSLGRKLLDGVREVEIDGQSIVVKARVRTVFGYSAHKDRDGLLDFIEKSSRTLKKVFIAMGEPRASMHLAQRVRDYLGIDAHVPSRGETVTLDLS